MRLSHAIRQILAANEVHERLEVKDIVAQVEALRGETDDGAVVAFLQFHIVNKKGLVGFYGPRGGLVEVMKMPSWTGID